MSEFLRQPNIPRNLAMLQDGLNRRNPIIETQNRYRHYEEYMRCQRFKKKGGLRGYQACCGREHEEEVKKYTSRRMKLETESGIKLDVPKFEVATTYIEKNTWYSILGESEEVTKMAVSGEQMTQATLEHLADTHSTFVDTRMYRDCPFYSEE